jgi:hypothetical protein
MLSKLRQAKSTVHRIENIKANIQNVHLDEEKSGISTRLGAETKVRRVKATRPDLGGRSTQELFKFQ